MVFSLFSLVNRQVAKFSQNVTFTHRNYNNAQQVEKLGHPCWIWRRGIHIQELQGSWESRKDKLRTVLYIWQNTVFCKCFSSSVRRRFFNWRKWDIGQTWIPPTFTTLVSVWSIFLAEFLLNKLKDLWTRIEMHLKARFFLLYIFVFLFSVIFLV